MPQPELTLVTDDGEIVASVGDASVALDFRLEAVLEREIQVDVEGSDRTAWLVQIGTPHLVVLLDSVEVADFDSVCRPIRSHAELGSRGANVDLVAATGTDSVSIRTFERGVEGETRACGSGAMATALALRVAGLADSRLVLETRSGASLTVAQQVQQALRIAQASSPLLRKRNSTLA